MTADAIDARALAGLVAERLARLAPDQRAAATAPPGPILCVAPAGSGKTTTLVTRIAWLVASGIDPATICAITFNRRAAQELDERLTAVLAPGGNGSAAGGSAVVRVRTFHALGREILRTAGVPIEPLLDRTSTLRRVAPWAGPEDLRRLDDGISRLKLDLGLTAGEVATDPDPGPLARTFVAYEAAVRQAGGLDFDDLTVRSLALLDSDPALLHAWRLRCAHLLVDEVQDVDRTQLRMALTVAAPANSIFLVGDDDQSIYGWRLADVRRVLGLADDLPGLRRIDLQTNYRCPAPVVERAVRLVEWNRARFAKTVRAGPDGRGRLVLAADAGDDIDRLRRVFRSWPADDGTRAVLARTNRELLPALVLALELDLPFRSPHLATPLDSPGLDPLLAEIEAETDPASPLLLRIAAVRSRMTVDPALGTPSTPASQPAPVDRGPDRVDPPSDGDEQLSFSRAELIEALLGWAPAFRDLASFRAAVAEWRARLARLESDDARLTLSTSHATKGLEFDHVAVIGMEAGRFPSRRSLEDAADPEMSMEEERRLAYVAWTRARRSLTLIYDPAEPSPFLLEAFSAAELGLASPSGS